MINELQSLKKIGRICIPFGSVAKLSSCSVLLATLDILGVYFFTDSDQFKEKFAVLLILFVLLRLALQFAANYVLAAEIMSVQKKMRDLQFENIESGIISKSRQSEINYSISISSSNICVGLFLPLFRFLSDLGVLLLISFGAILVLNAWGFLFELLFLLIFLMPVGLFLINIVSKRQKLLAVKGNKFAEEIQRAIFEYSNSSFEISQSGAKNVFRKNFSDLNQGYGRVNSLSQSIAAGVRPGLEALAILIGFLLYLFWGDTRESTLFSITIIGVIFLRLVALAPQAVTLLIRIAACADHAQRVLASLKPVATSKEQDQPTLTLKYDIEMRRFRLSLDTERIVTETEAFQSTFGSYVIRGPSGSGKTTSMLRAVFELPPAARERICFVASDRQNIFLGGLFFNVTYMHASDASQFEITRFEELITLFELRNLLTRETLEVEGLSKGEKDRIQMCRALYEEKDLIIFDETFSAIPKGLSSKIIQYMFTKLAYKQFVFIAHQDLFLEECFIGRSSGGVELLGVSCE